VANDNDDGTSLTESEAYSLLGDSVGVVATPWSKTTIERAQQIHENIVDRLKKLLRQWTSEKAAFRGIVQATYDSFHQLEIGKNSIKIELIRGKLKQKMAAGFDDEIKSRLQDAGVNYDSKRPFYPLFSAIEQGANSVGENPSKENKQLLTTKAKHVSFLLSQHYLPAFNQADMSGPFVDLLKESLQFLEEICSEVK
jgi:hypothetical protein